MPKQPLARGETYRVEAALAIGGETVRLAWSFRTAEPAVWEVDADAAVPWRTLPFALANARPGDTIRLGPGIHLVDRILYPAEVRITGAGPGATTLRYTRTFEYTPIAVAGAVVLERLTIEYAGAVIYVASGRTLLLREAAFAGGNGSHLPIALERGATLVVDRVDATGFRAPYLCFALEQGQAPIPACSRGRSAAGAWCTAGRRCGPWPGRSISGSRSP